MLCKTSIFFGDKKPRETNTKSKTIPVGKSFIFGIRDICKGVIKPPILKLSSEPQPSFKYYYYIVIL